METILQGLMELAGVRAAVVFDGTGQVVAWRGQAAYDRALCERVGAALLKAIESVQVQHDEWETISAQFADGRLLVRRVGGSGAARHVLAVVADAALNPSFATVALRVAESKVRAAVEGGGAQPAAGAPAPASGADAAATEFLARCGKELARHVGPISRVYVQEAVRRVSPHAPFSLAAARPLVEDLSSQIEDAAARAQFRRSMLESR